MFRTKPNLIYILKDCSEDAKQNVKQLTYLHSEISQTEDQELIKNKNNTLKNIVFKLKNSLTVEEFAEEFISFEGLKSLVDIIRITSGNTRVINKI